MLCLFQNREPLAIYACLEVRKALAPERMDRAGLRKCNGIVIYWHKMLQKCRKSIRNIMPLIPYQFSMERAQLTWEAPSVERIIFRRWWIVNHRPKRFLR